MRRREFIAGLGAATAEWPLATRAQRGQGARRIALFPLGGESDPEAQAYVRALRQGLEKRTLRWATQDDAKREQTFSRRREFSPTPYPRSFSRATIEISPSSDQTPRK
jgi:hypothetical protein